MGSEQIKWWRIRAGVKESERITLGEGIPCKSYFTRSGAHKQPFIL